MSPSYALRLTLQLITTRLSAILGGKHKAPCTCNALMVASSVVSGYYINCCTLLAAGPPEMTHPSAGLGHMRVGSGRTGICGGQWARVGICTVTDLVALFSIDPDLAFDTGP